jgi:hypothetical protein
VFSIVYAIFLPYILTKSLKIDAITGKEELTGFGKEYDYLIRKGYVYDETTGMMVLKK